MNKITQRTLNEKVEEILKKTHFGKDPLRLYFVYKRIFDDTQLRGMYAKPNHTLNELNTKFELVEKLRKIWLNFDRRQKLCEKVSTEVVDKFYSRLVMAASFIIDFKNGDQQSEDIFNEISILHMMGDVIVKAREEPFNETGRTLLNSAFTLANQYGSADESVRDEFKRIVIEAYKHSSIPGIPVDELNMVKKAMGAKLGSWYKCQNGHLYNIGDCGGAMQRSKCNECGLAIGGENHRLDSTNSLASEMDGATAPAWPQ